jgi:adenylate cyclase
MRRYDVEALDCWNAERRARGEPRPAIGIGLNYGPAVLGDIGSEHSFSFTVIGDTVNTASRLQRLTRNLRTPLVVGYPVVAAAGPATGAIAEIVARLEDRGEQPLRGRNEPVRIWARPDRSVEE